MPSGYKGKVTADSVMEILGYGVKIDGTVIDKRTDTEVERFVIDGREYVNAPGIPALLRSRDGLTHVADMVALAYKTPFIARRDLILLKAEFIDDSNSDYHPSNLVWVYPNEPIESVKYKGFYHIPGYSRYVISREGVVINTVKDRVKNDNTRTVGSKSISIRGDGWDANRMPATCVYRLLMLTFRGYPLNVSRLNINHIDGDRNNSSLNNLEWVSQSENIKHAVWRCVLAGYEPDPYLYKNDTKCKKLFLKLVETEARYDVVGNTFTIVLNGMSGTQIKSETLLPNGTVLSANSFAAFNLMHAGAKFTVTDKDGNVIADKVGIASLVRDYGFSKTGVYLAVEKSRPLHGTGYTVRKS